MGNEKRSKDEIVRELSRLCLERAVLVYDGDKIEEYAKYAEEVGNRRDVTPEEAFYLEIDWLNENVEGYKELSERIEVLNAELIREDE